MKSTKQLNRFFIRVLSNYDLDFLHVATWQALENGFSWDVFFCFWTAQIETLHYTFLYNSRNKNDKNVQF